MTYQERYDAIKRTIEEYTGEKVKEMNIDYYPHEWIEYNQLDHQNLHIIEIDGDEHYSGEVDEWNYDDRDKEVREAETIVLFQNETNIDMVILLRQIGTKNKHGVAYLSEEWLPENVFKNKLFSPDEQLRIIRRQFHSVMEDNVKFVNVRYE